MRIAYLYSRYPVVSQTFCDSEMLALESMGFELEVVSLNAPPDSFRHERLDRLKAEIHYPPPDRVLETKAKSEAFSRDLGPLVAEHEAKYGKSFKSGTRARNAWHFAPLLRKLGVSHVHVHFANRATHTALFLKKLGFTFSFTAHAQDFMVDLGSDDLLREMIQEAEFVIAVSDFSRQLLVEKAPASEEKIFRIYNGIELDDFRKIPLNRQNQPKFSVVSIGRLIEFKGFYFLITAVRLLKERGIDIDVQVIGDGPLRSELERQAIHQGVDSQIHFLGARSQERIKQELAKAQLFVLPSIVDRKGASDILPTVITEAMACSLPVVSTLLAGIPEMVAQGETGLLVEPGNAVALADAIAQLHGDAEKRQRFGAAGRARSEQLFALGVTAGQLGERFRKLQAGQQERARVESPLVYLVNTWDGKTLHLESLSAEARLRVIAGRASDDFVADQDTGLSQVEFMPDATVLESLWLRRSVWRHQLERLRYPLGGALDGEEFYRQARRAVWLADVLPRRGVKHLHAFRADAALCVWLVKGLIGIAASAAIEEAPELSLGVLAKILPDFDFVSVSDEKLASRLESATDDALQLKKMPTHREIRLGPLRLKLRAAPAVQDRSAMELAWFNRIAQNLHG